MNSKFSNTNLNNELDEEIEEDIKIETKNEAIKLEKIKLNNNDSYDCLLESISK